MWRSLLNKNNNASFRFSISRHPTLQAGFVQDMAAFAISSASFPRRRESTQSSYEIHHVCHGRIDPLPFHP